MEYKSYIYYALWYTGNLDPSVVYVPEDSGYRIVVEFKKAKSKEYSYYIYVDGNATEQKTATEDTYEYYYTTLEIPFGVLKESGERQTWWIIKQLNFL